MSAKGSESEVPGAAAGVDTGAAAVVRPAGMPDVPDANPDLRESLGGFVVLAADPTAGTVRMRFGALPRFCHSNGTTVQGGFVTAWLDCAMAHAVHVQSGWDINVSSLEIKVSFLERVAPGSVVAEARIVRRGRRVAFLEAGLRDDGGRLLATASSTVLLTQARSPNPPATPARN